MCAYVQTTVPSLFNLVTFFKFSLKKSIFLFCSKSKSTDLGFRECQKNNLRYAHNTTSNNLNSSPILIVNQIQNHKTSRKGALIILISPVYWDIILQVVSVTFEMLKSRVMLCPSPSTCHTHSVQVRSQVLRLCLSSVKVQCRVR